MPLTPPATPAFGRPIDDAGTKVASPARAIGGGTLTVLDGTLGGKLLSDPLPLDYVRLTCRRASDGAILNLKATARSGNVFTVTLDNTTDILLAVGDDVAIAVDARDVLELQTAIGTAYGSLGDVVAAVNTNTSGLAAKAPLASPAFTGTPTAPTAAQGTNTTQVATTAGVRAEVAALVASAPSTLDTLNELATALGDDPNFATTVTNLIALKAPIASPALTGTPTVPTATVGTNTTQAASCAFVLANGTTDSASGSDDTALGLALWFDLAHAGSAFTNTGATTPAASMGDPVLKLLGRTGGINATGNSGDRPTYNPTAFGPGRPGLHFADGSLMTDALMGSSASSLYMVVKQASWSSLKVLVSSPDGTRIIGTNENGTDASLRRLTLLGGPDGNSGGGGQIGWDGPDAIISIVNDGSGGGVTRIGINGAYVGYPATTPFLDLTTGLRLGRYGSGGYLFDGWLGEIQLYRAAHTPDQARRIEARLRAKWPVAGDVHDPQFTCVGNSITEGYGVTASYPVRLAQSLPGWRWCNSGIGGTTTPQLQARGPSGIAAYEAAHSHSVVVLSEIGNHLDYNYGSVSARQAVDAFWAWADAWRLGGWKVVACTVTPRNVPGDTNAAAVTTEINAANVLLRAEWPAHADALADVAADARLQDPTDATYYMTGNLHPNDAGYAVMASIVKSALLASIREATPYALTYSRSGEPAWATQFRAALVAAGLVADETT